MRPDPSQSDARPIEFTMQVEVGSMSMDEAIASGAFDLPDEPGMVRIPFSVNVMIPSHLLQPPPDPAPDPTVDDDLRRHRNGRPPRRPGSP